ncbi:GntR family transcriptional regulator [Kineococcus sp. SYSU DK004]|uniref:GntR family transcriptional regulator n=1 Tax=Kineococcus sp. SYSU DK004 TaxID=3383125 RepID=UPI003D7D4698
MDTASTSGAPPVAPPAAERVYAEVKAAILDRSLPGGQLVTEGELAARTGVSRTPVREGLLRLEAEGLVRLLPKRGALVVPVSPEEVEDVLEARELVEVHAAVRAWDRRAEFTGELAAHLERMRAAQAAGDAWEFMGADRAFHATVVRAAGNRVLADLYDGLRDRQMRMGVANMRGSADRVAVALADHEALLEVARTGDLRTWRELVRRHVRSAGDRLRSTR